MEAMALKCDGGADDAGELPPPADTAAIAGGGGGGSGGVAPTRRNDVRSSGDDAGALCIRRPHDSSSDRNSSTNLTIMRSMCEMADCSRALRRR